MAANKLNKDRIFKAVEGYLRAGKMDKAVAEYEKWIAANPKDWNSIRQAGDLYARIGQNPEAIKKYSQVAEYYRSDGFNVRAIATYKMILKLDPQNEEAMSKLAELQVAQGLLMEAKSQYQTLVELYTKTGQHRRAAEVFRKLAEIDPSNLKVRYKYAEFLERQGQVQEAIAEYLAIADQFVNSGLVPEAIQIMEKGLRIDSANRALRCKLAQSAMLQGDYAKAVRLLSEIRDKHPRDMELLSRLGEAHMGAGDFDAAEAVFRKLAELEPGNPDHASRRAELAMSQGHFDQALETLTPVVDRFVADGNGTKAAALLQKLLHKDPHHVKTLLKLAEVHTVSRQEQQRLSAYDQLCEAYAYHGDYEKAARVAEQLIELEPESSQHRDRLRFLKSRLGAPSVSGVSEATSSSRLEIDLSGIGSFEASETLEGAFSESLPELTLGDDEVEEVAEVPAESLGGIEEGPGISPEDDEHIKDKLTEAEVFVRYGLVDKAVEQLKDILESFRFHTGSREKLIEVYKDQGMNREAAQQMVQLAQVYEQLGRGETARALIEEARTLDPTVAEVAEPSVPAEEEIELSLSPEEDLAGIEEHLIEEPDVPLFEEELPIRAPVERLAELPSAPPARESRALPSAEADLEFSLDEPQEFPIEVDLEGAEAAQPAAAEVLMSEPALDVPSEPEELSAAGAEEEITFDTGGDDLLGQAPSVLGMDSADELDVQLDLGPTDSHAAEEQLGVEPDEVREELFVELPVGDAGGIPVQEEAEEQGEISLDFEQAAEPFPEPEPPRTPLTKQESRPAPPVAAQPVAHPELREVDEYIALGLYDDARATLRDLLRKIPEDPEVLAKVEELGFSVPKLRKEAGGPAVVPAAAESAVRRPPPAAAPADEEPLAELAGVTEPGAGEDELPRTAAGVPEPFVDLASELSEEMFETQSAVEGTGVVQAPSSALSDPGLEEIFREFKKGVEKQLGTEDYDTRYNLGIAYKEMGLLDEAIAEFQLASKDQTRLLECCSMLGLCFLEKGMPEIAIKWFEKGLAAPGRSEEEYHGLRYDLAQAHEAAGDPERALGLYMDIYRVNARFRDVRERVRGLQAAKK